MGVITGYSSWEMQLYHSIETPLPDMPSTEKPVGISEVVGYPSGFT
jgi:hypothetical protein